MASGPLSIHHHRVRKDPGLVAAMIRVFCNVELGSALLNKIVLPGEARILTTSKPAMLAPHMLPLGRVYIRLFSVWV